MKSGVYSVFDRKAVLFGGLLFFANDEMAKRGALDLLREGGDTPMNRYPEDFDVYAVGEFDNSDGDLVGHKPRLVCRFADFVVRQPADAVSEEKEA